jgi:hypothetical protein
LVLVDTPLAGKIKSHPGVKGKVIHALTASKKREYTTM